MAIRVADDYTGTVGPVPDAAALSADTLNGSPDYVASGGHDGLGTAVEFAPEEYAIYVKEFGNFESERIWVKTPAAMDGVGQDWSVFEFVDGADNPIIRAGWNPNRRWKLYNVATAVSNTSSSGTAAALSTQYGLVFEYDMTAKFMTLRVYNADDTERVVLYGGMDIAHPPAKLRVGNRQPSDSPIILSDFTSASHSLTIGDPPPATLGLVGTRLGIPTDTTVKITTYTGTDIDQVRVRIQNPSGHVTVTTSTALFPDSRGYATHNISALVASTDYEHVIEGHDPDTDTWSDLDNPWTGSDPLGPWTTFPAPDTSNVSFRFAGEACAHKQPQRSAYDKILARTPLFKIKGGDQNYRDETAEATPPHYDAWEDSWAIDNGMAETDSQIPTAYERSDHDGGEGGNSGAGLPGTIYALQAIKTLAPVLDILSPNTMAQSFRLGRHTFILPDFRSQYRTDYNAPSGTRTSYGTAQRQALIDKIHEAGQRGDMIWYCSDPIVLGDRDVLVNADPPKTDALPVYTEDYTAICAALAWYPTQHAWLAADYHALGFKLVHPLTGGPVFNYAGSVTQFGNMRDPESYDEVFNPESGSRGNVFFDWDVDQVDDIVTVLAHGWNAKDNVEVISPDPIIFDLSSPPPLPEPVPLGMEFLFNGIDVSSMAFGIEEVSQDVLAMRGENAVIPYWDGRQWNAFKSYDETDITFMMYAIGADPTTGEMPLNFEDQAVLCRANLDRLMRVFSSPDLVEIRKRFGDEYRIIYGQVVNKISFSKFNPRFAKFAVTFRCPNPFWRSETLVSQTLDYDYPSVGNLWFTDFAGSTARAQQMLIEAYGQLDEPRFSETTGRGSFRYTGTVQSPKRLTVDIAAGTAFKDTPDDPLDPVDDEIELIEKFEAGPLLTLNPRTKDEADGAYGLRINVSEPPGVGAKVTMTGFKWYTLHG